MLDGAPARRVVIIDDNAITAYGAETLLAPDPRIDVVATLTHAEAMAATLAWESIDVVLLDVTDPDQPDQFPGIAVARKIRAIAPGPAPSLVVLTDRFAHEGLRRRLREAKADFCFLREDVRAKLDLCELVMHPERWRRTPQPEPRPPDPNLGLNERSDVNAVIAYMAHHGLAAAWTSGNRQRTREDHHHRAELTRLARHITPMTLEGAAQRVARKLSSPLRQLPMRIR